MVPQASSAQVESMAVSHRPPLTSLTISAPASMARRAVAAWVGVDREDGFGPSGEDGGEDGENAGLFFCGGERDCAGAGGLAAEVEKVGSGVEHL